MVPSLVAKRLEHETKWHLVIEIHQTQPAKSCKTYNHAQSNFPQNHQYPYTTLQIEVL